jgi:hypothetical protein
MSSTKFLIGIAIPVSIISVAITVLWLNDIRHDRSHTIIANAPTPIFAGNGGESECTGKALLTAAPGTKLSVRRIRYLKSCATFDVALPDGRAGYVILGVGSVSVDPALPTLSSSASSGYSLMARGAG